MRQIQRFQLVVVYPDVLQLFECLHIYIGQQVVVKRKRVHVLQLRQIELCHLVVVSTEQFQFRKVECHRLQLVVVDIKFLQRRRIERERCEIVLCQLQFLYVGILRKIEFGEFILVRKQVLQIWIVRYVQLLYVCTVQRKRFKILLRTHVDAANLVLVC